MIFRIYKKHEIVDETFSPEKTKYIIDKFKKNWKAFTHPAYTNVPLFAMSYGSEYHEFYEQTKNAYLSEQIDELLE